VVGGLLGFVGWEEKKKEEGGPRWARMREGEGEGFPFKKTLFKLFSNSFQTLQTSLKQ
jgi:hypothetical protein